MKCGPVRRLLTLSIGLVPVFLAPVLNAQQRLAKEFERIRDEAFAGRHASDLLAHLCDRVGPRLTGSAAHALAVEWLAAELTARGLGVRVETETIPTAWHRGPVRMRITAPIRRELDAIAGPWTPALAKVREFRVVRSVPDAAAGAPTASDAVLVDPTALPLRVRERHPFPGAGALIVDSSRPRALHATALATFAPPFVASAVPAVFVTAEDALLLGRLLDAGDEVSIALEGGGSLAGETRVGEVIAEIPAAGVDPAAEARTDAIVFAFCGLDSWDLGTGATADGAGVVVLAEAARILAELGRRPERTIRFAFLAGTAQGAGSTGYARRHAAELARHRYAFAIEGGSGRFRGVALDGVQSDLERFEQFFAPVRDLGATDVGFRGPRTELTRALKDGGVRAFAFVQEAPEVGIIDGTGADTFDKVLARDLQEAACIVATVLWAAANELR